MFLPTLVVKLTWPGTTEERWVINISNRDLPKGCHTHGHLGSVLSKGVPAEMSKWGWKSCQAECSVESCHRGEFMQISSKTCTLQIQWSHQQYKNRVFDLSPPRAAFLHDKARQKDPVILWKNSLQTPLPPPLSTLLPVVLWGKVASFWGRQVDLPFSGWRICNRAFHLSRRKFLLPHWLCYLESSARKRKMGTS